MGILKKNNLNFFIIQSSVALGLARPSPKYQPAFAQVFKVAIAQTLRLPFPSSSFKVAIAQPLRLPFPSSSFKVAIPQTTAPAIFPAPVLR